MFTRSNVFRCAQILHGMLALTLGARFASAGFDIVSVGGDASTASIQASVDSFRAMLGANNGNAPGPLAGGRREINWDGGGSTIATPVGTPMTTFQNNRGGIFTTPGSGFVQTPVDDAALTGLQPSYATTFGAFSPVRIFTPLGSNIMEATFAVPGSNGTVPATVAGFGAIFSDVDTATTTTMEFFDASNNSLQLINVPQGTVSSASMSFAGGVANAGEQIARVRIVTGNSALGPPDSNGDPFDVVVVDDFIYGEPVPEPAAMGTVILACAGWLSIRRRLMGNRNALG